VAAADLALLARDTPEGRAPLWMCVLDARHPWCRTLAKSARATPPLLGPRFDPNDDTVAATVAYFKAAAYDKRYHKLREAIAFCRDVEAGTEICTSEKARELGIVAWRSPLWTTEDGNRFADIRKTQQQSAAEQKVLFLGPLLQSFALDGRAEERLAENYSRHLDECDEAGRNSRALLSREGHVEALYLATTKLLAAHDDLTFKRLGALIREARTELGLRVNNVSGTTRVRAEAFLVILRDALAVLPAEDQVKARVEAYENKWEPKLDEPLAVADHEATLETYEHGDQFAFDPSRWNDADVDASRAALREHYTQPRSHWATHHGMLQPGLIAEDPPETLRDGPAFHVNHYKPEDAEDIVRDLHRAGL
jgi:hypothetical protein